MLLLLFVSALCSHTMPGIKGAHKQSRHGGNIHKLASCKACHGSKHEVCQKCPEVCSSCHHERAFHSHTHDGKDSKVTNPSSRFCRFCRFTKQQKRSVSDSRTCVVLWCEQNVPQCSTKHCTCGHPSRFNETYHAVSWLRGTCKFCKSTHFVPCKACDGQGTSSPSFIFYYFLFQCG